MNATAALPSAELPIRILARALDVALLVALQLALGRAMGFGYDWLLLGSVGILAYFAAFDALAGATPGKRVLRLRVIRADGGRPSLRQAVVREAFTVIGAIPFVGPLLALGAWIWIGLTIRRSPLRREGTTPSPAGRGWSAPAGRTRSATPG